MSGAQDSVAVIVEELARTCGTGLPLTVRQRELIVALQAQQGAPQGGTPSSRWSANGEPDPHGTRYDCERAALAMGDMSDDELANAVFMCGDAQPSMADLVSGKAMLPSAYLMAAKDRIRWLSRKLAATTPQVPEQPAEQGAVVDMRAALQCCYDALMKFAQSGQPPYGDLTTAMCAAETALATPSPVEAVLFDEAKATAIFADYFRKNYPGPNTIICDPDWHAPKLFRAAKSAIKQATPPSAGSAPSAPRIRHSCDLDMLSDCPACSADAEAAIAIEYPSAPPVGVEGWVMVPKVPTDAMLAVWLTPSERAGGNSGGDTAPWMRAFRRYGEMLAATPAVSVGDAKDALRAFMAHVEKHQRVDQHNPYTARELYADLFAMADAALASAASGAKE